MPKGVYLSDAIESKGANFPAIRPGTSQRLAFKSGAVSSEPFGTGTELILLTSTDHCYVKFGENPVATPLDIFIVAETPYYFGVTPGERLSVLPVQGAGDLSVIEAT